jgi:hypothetical protein
LHKIRRVHGAPEKKTSSIKDKPMQQSATSLTSYITNYEGAPDGQDIEFCSKQNEILVFTAEHGDNNEQISASEFNTWTEFEIPFDFGLSSEAEDSSAIVEMSPAREVLPDSYGDVHLHLFHSPEDEATCFFFQNYVWTDLATPYNHLECLPLIFDQTKEMGALSGIVISIGTAGISNIRKDPELMHSAKENYLLTMRRTQILLKDQGQIQEDQTLLVVLLLALFEV